MNWIGDVRYGARVLFRSPGYSLFVIVMLSVGIASITTILSVSRAVLWDTPPFRDPGSIVELESRTMDGQSATSFPLKAADYLDFRQRSRTLRELSLFNRGALNITGDGNPERLVSVSATASAFQLLGVPPLLGRTFEAEQEQAGKNRVLILSHGLWTRRFAADPGIAGKSVLIDGASYTVIAVMPPRFDFPDSGVDVWTPLVLDPKEVQARFVHRYRSWARLAPGASRIAAHQEARNLAAQFREENPRLNRNIDAAVVPWNQRASGAVRPALKLLGAAVALLLLLVCANIANLMIARLTARAQEFRIRSALGGGAGTLIRQLFAESFLLAISGGLAGVLLARGLLAAVVRIAPQGISNLDRARLDLTTLALALLITVFTAVLFGLLPAWSAARGDLASGLRTRGEGANAGSNRVRQILATAQLALAVVVLIASGLLLRSFANVLATPLGFQPSGLLTARVALPPSKYASNDQIADFFGRLLDRLKSQPGVENAAVINRLPLDGSLMTGPVQLRNVPDDRQRITQVDHRAISPNYFRVAGIPLLSGREFTEADSAAATPVVIVDETVAKTYFPGEDPLGKVIQPGSPQIGLPWSTIVGVVGPIHNDGLEVATRGQVYAPLPQRPRPANHSMGVVLKASGGKPEDLAPGLRAAVQELDPNQPVSNVSSMETLLARTLAARRFSLWLLALFSAVCVLLSGLGLYAVISYSVTQRVREVGVRMALGAEPMQITGLFLRQGAVTWAGGLFAGGVGSLALSRLYASMLFSTPGFDFVTLAAVALGLGALALSASYLPARRAARLDPATVLRSE